IQALQSICSSIGSVAPARPNLASNKASWRTPCPHQANPTRGNSEKGINVDTKWFARRGVKRALAAVTAVGMIAGLAACSPGEEADREEITGAFDWKRFDGESIELLLNQHPWQIAIEPRLAEFEELTGITVNVT